MLKCGGFFASELGVGSVGFAQSYDNSGAEGATPGSSYGKPKASSELSACPDGAPWHVNDLIDDQVSASGIVFFRVLGDDKGPGHFRGSSFCNGRVRRRPWRGENAGPEPMRAGCRERET